MFVYVWFHFLLKDGARQTERHDIMDRYVVTDVIQNIDRKILQLQLLPFLFQTFLLMVRGRPLDVVHQHAQIWLIFMAAGSRRAPP